MHLEKLNLLCIFTSIFFCRFILLCLRFVLGCMSLFLLVAGHFKREDFIVPFDFCSDLHQGQLIHKIRQFLTSNQTNTTLNDLQLTDAIYLSYISFQLT